MAKQQAAAARGSADVLIRDAILRHLFTVHRSAKSPSKAAVGIRELHSALKASRGYKQQEVGSNLDYLVQKRWVTEVRIPGQRGDTDPLALIATSRSRRAIQAILRIAGAGALSFHDYKVTAIRWGGQPACSVAT